MTFKDILTNLDDQVLKGLVLKVKNECMKKDIKWSELRVFLKNLKMLIDIIAAGIEAETVIPANKPK